jgi:N-acyl homoserine lactone hydrolase
MTKLRLLGWSLLALAVCASALPLAAPAQTSHHVVPSSLGVARPLAALEAVVDVPGPVVVETVTGGDWVVPRAGLINLDDPKAKAANLANAPEPVVILFHALHHPTAGLYLVDTGVERALRDDPKHAALHGVVARVMGIDALHVQTDTASWLATQEEPVAGVFLTHMHADHLSGMRDVPSTAVVYTGPGEAAESHVTNFLVRPVVDATLEGKGDIHEWQFARDASGSTDAGVVDVFGDGTVWAIPVPGHTDGSTAYLARTPRGPVLFTGDACHTVWGWDHDVEPGTYSTDRPRSRASLDRLVALARRHPSIDVRLGHQIRPMLSSVWATPAAAPASSTARR